MARITIRLPDSLDDRVEDKLDYGEAKSEWYRRAALEKLERHDASGSTEAATQN